MANITQVVENIAYGTASLYGTASWALNSKTASYISSSNIIGNVTALSASWASSSLSSSYPWFTTGSNIAYVGGNVGIGTTGPISPLNVVGKTTLGQVTNSPANYLTIGGNAPASAINSEMLGVYSQGITQGGLVFASYRDDAGAGEIDLAKARGTVASPASVQSGDKLGDIFGHAYTNAWKNFVADIRFSVEGTVTNTAVPTNMTFLTTPAGSVTSREVMRIDSSGNVGIGTTGLYSGTGVTSLTLNATTYPVILFQTGGTGNNGTVGYTWPNTYLQSNNDTNVALLTAHGNLTLLDNGNVGIGTISPVNRLDVVGNISCSVITASLFFGTASRATNALTAAYVSNTGVVIDTTGMNVNNATTYGVTGINFSSGITYVSSSGIIFTSGNSYKDGAATASLFGTASWALNAKTASYISSTNISGNVTAFSASWASSSLSSSYPWLTTAANISYVGGNVGIGVSAFGSTAEKLLVSGTTYNVISGVGTLDNYLQLNIKNSSAGVAASSDIVATNNTGNETGNFVDLGINSSGYTSNVVGLQNDGYLYNTGSNFYIGNITTGKNLYLFAGGTADTASVIINSSKNVGIGTISPVNKLDVFGNISCSIITASLFYGTASRATTATTALSSSIGVSSDSTNYNLTMVVGSGNQPLLADTHPSLVWNPGTTGVGLLKVGGLLNLRDPNSTTVLYRDTYIEDAGGAIRFTTSGSTYTTFGVTGNITIPVTANLVGTSSWAVSASWAPSVVASLYVTGAIYASSSISASWASRSLVAGSSVNASSSVNVYIGTTSTTNNLPVLLGVFDDGGVYPGYYSPSKASMIYQPSSNTLYATTFSGSLTMPAGTAGSPGLKIQTGTGGIMGSGTNDIALVSNGINVATFVAASATDVRFQINTTNYSTAFGQFEGNWFGATNPLIVQPLSPATAHDIAFTGTQNTPLNGIVIKAAGNVGIGQIVPNTKLHVNSGLPSLTSLTLGSGSWTAQSVTSNLVPDLITSPLKYDSSAAGNTLNKWAFYNQPGGAAYGIGMSATNGFGLFAGDRGFVFSTGVTYVDGTGASPKMTILNGGNVGIGVFTPINKLDVVGNISCSVITASLFYGTASYAVSASWAPSSATSNITSKTTAFTLMSANAGSYPFEWATTVAAIAKSGHQWKPRISI